MFSSPSLIASRLLFVGLLIEVVELWMLRRAFDDGGPFAPSTTAILTSGAPWHSTIGASLGGSGLIRAIAVCQAAAAIVVIATGTATKVGIAAALVCLATAGFLHTRRQIGSSGAEQLTMIALATFGLVLLAGGSAPARQIGDAFIAAQLVLAYFASGAAKAVSPTWRRGEAMRGILSTEGYGQPALAQILVAHPSLDKAACWSVVAWEVAFPVVLLAPKSVMIGMLAIGVGFHVGCAGLMGLNRFPWAFCGCYASVWVTASEIRRVF